MKTQEPKAGNPPTNSGGTPAHVGASGPGHRVAWAVLVISLLASAGGWWISLKHSRLEEQMRFSDEVERVRSALAERLSVYENLLQGGAGLIVASESVSRSEWRAYVRSITAHDRFPGLDGMGFVEPVDRQNVDAYEAAMRADGAAAFTVQAVPGPDQLLVIRFLEPEEGRQNRLGQTLNADPSRMAAATLARDNGVMAVSSQVQFEDGMSGILMLQPVYRGPGVPATVEERRRQFAGLVYARFVMPQLINEVFGNTERKVRIRVLDGEEQAAGVLLYDSESGPGAASGNGGTQWTDRLALRTGGRTWTLEFISTPAFRAGSSRLIAQMTGMGGLIVSLLLFGIAWSLSRTRQQAVRLAANMTAALREANAQLTTEVLDRERAQQLTKDSEALYHSLVENLPLNIFRKDLQGRFTFANQRFCEEMGRPLEAILGRTDFDLVPSRQAALHKQQEEWVIESGASVEEVQELRLSDTDNRFVQVIKSPLRDSAGKVIGLQGIFWDVTDKHRMERELQQERDLLHTLLDNVPDRIYFKDAQSRFLRVSRAMQGLFKVNDASEVVGKTDFDFFGEVHARQAYDDEQRIIRTGQPVIGLVEKLDLPDGQHRWAWTTKMPMRDPEGRVIGTFGITRDITQMKEAEAELQNERDLLHTLLDNLPDRIYFKDRDSRFVRVSRAMLGLHHADDPQEMLGKTDFDFFTNEHAQQAFDDEQRIIRTGKPMIGLVEKETLPGGVIRWASTTKMPLRNEKGEIIGTFGISRDITDLKNASEALQAAKEAAEEANQTKSQFLANMSHELRTPLNSIIGFSNILMKNRDRKLGESELSFLGRILANGKHLLDLINQILDLSKIEARKVELELSSVDLGQLVRQTIEQQEGLVRDRPVQLRIEAPDTMAPLQTDPDKLRQILINLIGNSLKFTEQGSVIVRVRVDPVHHRPQRIDVEDTGLGIAREKLGAIFQAFHQADTTTARKFGGTGLGLTISHALCELMGYRLEVSSETGKGSIFSVIFSSSRVGASGEPAVEAAKSDAFVSPGAPGELAHLKGKRVLVIDDESDSRTLLRHMLQEFGCEVLEAESGEEGLDIARRRRPHLITVDLRMPRMTGAEVVGAIKGDPELREIPVVVVSIVSGEHRGHILGAVDLLQKPIGRENLLAVLQRNLPQPRRRILVVDDEEDSRELMRSLLEPEHFEVQTTSNGQEALEALKQSPCELVLLDLMMPEMDGFTFLNTLRGRPAFRNVPVVVVTAKDLSREELEELRRNASDVLPKSAAFEQDLKAVLHRFFEPTPAGGTPGSRRNSALHP